MLVGARAVRALPAGDEADGSRGRRRRPRGRRRASHVRRHHPGPGGHGAQPVQPRRHRDVDGDRAVARRVRRRPHARRLRQDRARPASPARCRSATCRRRSCRPARWRRGRSNAEKAETRKAYAAGEAGRDELLASEVASYHSPGTCTFYGTANSNQMLMDVMGLHLPGAAFVHPDDPVRDALTDATTRRVAEIAASEQPYGIGQVVDEKCGRQRRRRPARDRWLDQPHDAPDLDGGRRGHRPDVGGLRRPVGRRPVGRAHLPQRHRRREPLPRRPVARRSSCAPCSTRGLLHEDVLTARRARPAPLHAQARAGRRRARVRRGPGRVARPVGPASGDRPVRRRRRPACPAWHPRPRRHQGLGRRRRAQGRRGARARLHRPGRLPPGVLPPRARPRRRRRHPRAGTQRQRDARAARAHALPRRPAEARPCRRPGHRRPHERGVRARSRPRST